MPMSAMFVTVFGALLILAPHAFAAPNGCARTANAEMCSLVKHGRPIALLRGDSRDISWQVDDLYRSSNYQLIWVANENPTPQARKIIRSLEEADKVGLLPADYDGPRWEGRLFELAHFVPQSKLALARFDLALTTSAMRFISDLRCGRNSLQQRRFGSHSGCGNGKMAELVRNLTVDAAPTGRLLKEAEPDYESYRRLKTVLQQYLAIDLNGETKLRGENEEPVKPGDRCPFLAQLGRRLLALGDLPENKSVPGDSTVYQGILVEAIKRFQARHGLSPDGIIDAETLRQLNVPIRQRILQLQLAMERWRWLPHDPPGRFILINIAGFTLTAFNSKGASVTMKTIVGEASDEDQGHDHRTPLMQSALESLVFFPMWNIPPRIAIAEVLPAILEDPEFLTNHQYELVNREGSTIATASSTPGIFQKILDGQLHIRQKPGPENPLGTIKFMFRNTYDVYIHGTPEKELFSYARRDYSHGCIRVEEPVTLAEWLLSDQAPNTATRIVSTTTNDAKKPLEGATSPSFTITLKKSIPLFIIYQTAAIGKNDEVYFFDDIYGMDSELATAIDSRR